MANPRRKNTSDQDQKSFLLFCTRDRKSSHYFQLDFSEGPRNRSFFKPFHFDPNSVFYTWVLLEPDAVVMADVTSYTTTVTSAESSNCLTGGGQIHVQLSVCHLSWCDDCSSWCPESSSRKPLKSLPVSTSQLMLSFALHATVFSDHLTLGWS